MPATEVSLKVGEFDEHQLGGFLAFHRRPIETEHHVLGLSGGSSGGGRRSSLQEGFNLLQVLLQTALAFFDGFDLSVQGLGMNRVW